MDIALEQMQSVLCGRLRLGNPPPRDGEYATVGPIVTDSRLVQPGDVFWALSSPRRNGADFAIEAMARGASGVIVADRQIEPWAGSFVLEVEDTKLALWQLADWNRRRCGGLVIAVTGSVGKTTTREMIDAVLRPAGAGFASPKNFNNDIGVPLSLLLLKPEHDYAVLELGASAKGEVDALARLAAPQVGVITRIGDAHLGTFGDQQQIAAAKAELLSVLGSESPAVLSGDDPWLRRLAGVAGPQVVWFGRSGDCDVSATEVYCCDGHLKFRVGRQAFVAPVWGRHQLDAALAAIAVGLIYGRSLAEVADALAQFKPVARRCNVLDVGGIAVLDDTCNSSPMAVRAALQLLAEHPAKGRRIALLGDMGEMGMHGPRMHFDIGKHVVTTAGADRLFICGEYAAQTAAGAMEAGMRAEHVQAIAEPLACAGRLREQIAAGDVLLVKGSRAMALDRVIDLLAGATGSESTLSKAA
ncbi:MAG: UDP-N-acetylmuramoyl-tripeptide--D-alanyl-D-alanine ligase [Planctomycetia bacterium]|nr:UDP-N-acetylmuramoyl-tripeptide--D-alanyl-D-alanine ligase [Planctomycetia bacterium]